MLNKKAQSEIITTVLIILLVLAAIVIVWQVISKTVKGGAGQLESQSSCFGVSMEVEATDDPEVFVIKRGVGGDDFGDAVATNDEGRLKIIQDGTSIASTGIGINKDFGSPLTSQTVTLTSTPATSLEVALVLPDGTVCPNTGLWKASG